ncbi:helix-turn-helix domain-containing protein [Kordiimonas marina]|uniref:helix-turn-helix domain-containing protein n=1 Tax=Kordiimonas marina TaxID=2872312 RepID=UPI001FF6D5C8|nr:XRE family transcriptional regulator [Kordiimonas marina]MCJ9427980.1 XRE family transcriptional regulator [Kordiimonas marina]
MEKGKLKLGEKIRKLRRERGLSLTQMSDKTDIAQSTLSKIENDVISPGFDKVVSICKGLEVDITDLLHEQIPVAGSPARPTARMTVSRKGEGETVSSEAYESRYLCSMISKKGMIPMVVDLKLSDGDENEGQMISHPGEEYIYVLEGSVKVLLDQYAPIILEEGDSLYIDSPMGHLYVATGGKPARILGVTLAAD